MSACVSLRAPALVLAATAAMFAGQAIPASSAPAPRAGVTAPSVIVLAEKKCRREPIWGFRISAFCKPTGICPDRVIKGYRTVCS